MVTKGPLECWWRGTPGSYLLGGVPRILGGTRRALGVLVARHSEHHFCWVESRELPPEQSYGALNRNVRSQSSPGADQELKGRRPGRNKQVFFLGVLPTKHLIHANAWIRLFRGLHSEDNNRYGCKTVSGSHECLGA